MTRHPIVRLARACCAVAVLAAAPSVAGAQTGYDPATRMSTLEEQVRQLNGQVEQLTHMVRQLQDQMRRMSEDTEYRFQQLGQGGGGRSSVAAQPQSQPPQGQIAQGQIAQGQFPQGQYPQGQFPQGQSPQGQLSNGQAPAETRPQFHVMAQDNQTGALGQGPQTLGQIPGVPLDLSSALGQPLPDPRYPQQQGLATGGSTLGGQTYGSQPAGAQPGSQLVMAPTNSPKDSYDLAYGYILRGEFDMAEASFREFLYQYPGDALAGNAQYWLGESLFARAMYRDAADAFLKGYSDYPEGAKAPESLYKLGMSLKELGQADAACSTFAEIPRRYPRAPQAVQERTRSEMQKSGC